MSDSDKAKAAKVTKESAPAKSADKTAAKSADKPVAVTTRRRLSGIVVCDKADKTVRVRADRRVRHALYEKSIRRRGGVQAHDENNLCRVGDKVIVEETPRRSKTKAWRVVERQGEAV